MKQQGWGLRLKEGFVREVWRKGAVRCARGMVVVCGLCEGYRYLLLGAFRCFLNELLTYWFTGAKLEGLGGGGVATPCEFWRGGVQPPPDFLVKKFTCRTFLIA